MTDAPSYEARVCRCPSCSERFLLTDDVMAQARAASGNVRCGACLAVFNAEANVISETAELPEQARWPAQASFGSEEPPPAQPFQQAAPEEALEPEPAAGDDAPWRTADDVPISPPLRGARLAPSFGQPRRAKAQGGGRTGVWAMLVLIGLVGLGANLLALQFPVWVQQPEMRGIYETACELIGCDLPMRRALGAIDILDPVVERQVDSQTLELRAHLVNNATFRQPLPRLTLRFVAANGDTVAEHSVPARDYRTGAVTRVSPKESMPMTVRVADPGNEAVSYALTLL